MQVTHACEQSPLQLKYVSSHLTIVVSHRDKPIAGVAVSVIRENSGEEVFSGFTDRLGMAHMPELSVGKYFVSASLLGIDALREWIEVQHRSSPKAAKVIDIHWAEWSYATRHVTGTLTGRISGNTGNKIMDIVHPVETVYAGVEMTLKSAVSDDEYHTLSDSSGAFLFGDVPDGVYLLTIPGGMSSVTGIADTTTQVIDVMKSASRNSLPLRLADTGCYRTEFQLAEN
jgi:hypothetical protein